MKLNDAVRKLLYTEQVERHLTMPRCKKGNTFPDESWHDGDDEFGNSPLIQKGRDDLASAHHPHILASLPAKAFGKGTNRLDDEVDARGYGSRRWPPRKHIAHGIRTEARAHLQTPIEGLAAEDLGIGGALEFRETVKALWSRPFRQPIEIAIGSSNVAIHAGRDIDDDFSLCHDTPMPVYTFSLLPGNCANPRKKTSANGNRFAVANDVCAAGQGRKSDGGSFIAGREAPDMTANEGLARRRETLLKLRQRKSGGCMS